MGVVAQWLVWVQRQRRSQLSSESPLCEPARSLAAFIPHPIPAEIYRSLGRVAAGIVDPQHLQVLLQ
ncbi:MAG: hypothetical protein AAFY11_04485 [Cyanobacteria bacterium J06641_5]